MLQAHKAASDGSETYQGKGKKRKPGINELRLIWKVLQIVAVISMVMLILAADHYDAVRHEFYKVWDSIEELRSGK